MTEQEPVVDDAVTSENGDELAAEPETGELVVPEADVVDFEQLKAQRDEYLDTLRRVQADFENARKRAARERAELLQRANEGLVEQLLPVLDSFHLALMNAQGKNADSASEDAKLRKGVELVYAELLSVLERAGLERIEAEGKPFDPVEHEAVMSVESENEGDDPVVAEVMRAGWRLKGRVLRPAMVKVAK
jgi:molecular chaperone GrpE